MKEPSRQRLMLFLVMNVTSQIVRMLHKCKNKEKVFISKKRRIKYKRGIRNVKNGQQNDYQRRQKHFHPGYGRNSKLSSKQKNTVSFLTILLQNPCMQMSAITRVNFAHKDLYKDLKIDCILDFLLGFYHKRLFLLTTFKTQAN